MTQTEARSLVYRWLRRDGATDCEAREYVNDPERFRFDADRHRSLTRGHLAILYALGPGLLVALARTHPESPHARERSHA